jgi:hypothetical protein
MRSTVQGNLGIALFVLQISLALASSLSPLAPDELRLKLDMPVQNYSLVATNFPDALARVAGKFHVPIGIEWVNAPHAREELTLTWKDTTVEKILEQITNTQPGYEMRIENGVVHILLSKQIPVRQDFLNITIDKFDVNNERPEVVRRRLQNVVKLTVSPPRTGIRGGTAGSIFGNADDPSMTVHLLNVSTGKVLDRMILESAWKIWIVTFSDDTALTRTGYRRTISLWNNYPIPDDEQPVWDMFHWSEPIPMTVLGRK